MINQDPQDTKYTVEELRARYQDQQFYKDIVEKDGEEGATNFLEALAENATREDMDTVAPLLSSIRKAESGGAGLEYGIIHERVEPTYRSQAGWSAATIQKNLGRWRDGGSKGEFIDFLGGRYAPLGVENDPNNLNKNWVPNVRGNLMPYAPAQTSQKSEAELREELQLPSIENVEEALKLMEGIGAPEYAPLGEQKLQLEGAEQALMDISTMTGDEALAEVREGQLALEQVEEEVGALNIAKGVDSDFASPEAQFHFDAELEEMIRQQDSEGAIRDANYQPRPSDREWRMKYGQMFSTPTSIARDSWVESISYQGGRTGNGIYEMFGELYGSGMYDNMGNAQGATFYIDNMVAQATEMGMWEDNPDVSIEEKTLAIGAMLLQDVYQKLGRYNPNWKDDPNPNMQRLAEKYSPTSKRFKEVMLDDNGAFSSTYIAEVQNSLTLVRAHERGLIPTPYTDENGELIELTNAEKDERLRILLTHKLVDGGGAEQNSSYRRHVNEEDYATQIAVKAQNLMGFSEDLIVEGGEPEGGLLVNLGAWATPTVIGTVGASALGGPAGWVVAAATVTDAFLQQANPREPNAANFLRMMGDAGMAGDWWKPLESLDEALSESVFLDLMSVKEASTQAQLGLIGALEGALVGKLVSTGLGLAATGLAITGKTLIGDTLSGAGRFAKSGARMSKDTLMGLADKLGLSNKEARIAWETYDGNVQRFYSLGPQLIIDGLRGIREGVKLTAKKRSEAVKGVHVEARKLIDSGSEKDLEKMGASLYQRIGELRNSRLTASVKAEIDELLETRLLLNRKLGRTGRPAGTYGKGRKQLYKIADDWNRAGHLKAELSDLKKMTAAKLKNKLINPDGWSKAEIEEKFAKAENAEKNAEILLGSKQVKIKKWNRGSETLYDFLNRSTGYTDKRGNKSAIDYDAEVALKRKEARAKKKDAPEGKTRKDAATEKVDKLEEELATGEVEVGEFSTDSHTRAEMKAIAEDRGLDLSPDAGDKEIADALNNWHDSAEDAFVDVNYDMMDVRWESRQKGIESIEHVEARGVLARHTKLKSNLRKKGYTEERIKEIERKATSDYLEVGEASGKMGTRPQPKAVEEVVEEVVEVRAEPEVKLADTSKMTKAQLIKEAEEVYETTLPQRMKKADLAQMVDDLRTGRESGIVEGMPTQANIGIPLEPKKLLSWIRDKVALPPKVVKEVEAIDSLTYKEARAKAKEKGLNTKGKAAEIKERLRIDATLREMAKNDAESGFKLFGDIGRGIIDRVSDKLGRAATPEDIKADADNMEMQAHFVRFRKEVADIHGDEGSAKIEADLLEKNREAQIEEQAAGGPELEVEAPVAPKPKPKKRKIDVNERKVKEKALDDARAEKELAEEEEILDGGTLEEQVELVRSRAGEVIAALDNATGAAKGAAQELDAHLLRAFVMMQRALARLDELDPNKKVTQKGFMVRKVLPPSARAEKELMMEWANRSKNNGLLMPSDVKAELKAWAQGLPKAEGAARFSTERIDAMLRRFETSKALKTRRVHTTTNIFFHPIRSTRRVAGLLKDYGNAGLVSSIGTQAAAGMGMLVRFPRLWVDATAMLMLSKLPAFTKHLSLRSPIKGGTLKDAREFAIVVRKMRAKIKENSSERFKQMSMDEIVGETPQSLGFLRRVLSPSSHNYDVAKGVGERAATAESHGLSSAALSELGDPLTYKPFALGKPVDVPASGLTKVGFRAAEIENPILRDLALTFVSFHEFMPREVMSNIVDKTTKSYGGELHGRELLKELVSNSNKFGEDGAGKITPDDRMLEEMYYAMQEWSLGRHRGSIGADVNQGNWLRQRLGLWTDEKQAAKDFEKITDNEGRLHPFAQERLDSGDWAEEGTASSYQELIFQSLDGARSRMEELTLQHSTDKLSGFAHATSQHYGWGWIGRFGKTFSNSFTMGIESTPIAGQVWAELMKDGKGMTDAMKFNAIAKQTAFMSMLGAGHVMYSDKVRDMWTVKENGDVALVINETMEDVKAAFMARFQTSPRLLTDMINLYDQKNGTNYGDTTEGVEAYLEEVAWRSLKPEKGRSIASYDRGGYVGGLLNMMVRASWYIGDYSPRFSDKELSDKGFIPDMVDGFLNMVTDLSASWVTDLYKTVTDFGTSDTPLEDFVSLIIAEPILTPAVGLVGDFNKSGASHTKKDTNKIYANVMGSHLFQAFSDDRLETRRDFFGMPIEKDRYGMVDKLKRRDYQSTWYEQTFEDLQIVMRPPAADAIIEGINLRDFRSIQTKDGSPVPKGSEYNAYEKYNDTLVMMTLESDYGGGATTLEDECQLFMKSVEGQELYRIAMTAHDFEDEDVIDRDTGKPTLEWEVVMEARNKIQDEFGKIRKRYTTVLKDAMVNPTPNSIDSWDFSWIGSYKGDMGESLLESAVASEGPMSSKSLAKKVLEAEVIGNIRNRSSAEYVPEGFE